MLHWVQLHLHKWEYVGTYLHLLILLTAKTALTYVRPLQLVCQRSSLAQWFSAWCDATRSRVELSLELKFVLLFFFLQFSFYCPQVHNSWMISVGGLRVMYAQGETK